MPRIVFGSEKYYRGMYLLGIPGGLAVGLLGYFVLGEGFGTE